MSYDVATGAVVAVLNEVNGEMQAYEALFTSVAEQLSSLAAACMAEPVSAELQSLASEVLQPALQTVAGRSGAAVSAVNEVVTILTTADIDMSTSANQALVRTEQAKVDDMPDAGGSTASMEPAHHNIPR
jgi:hypothetical protein